jgi:arylsulfatase A-like enzyme
MKIKKTYITGLLCIIQCVILNAADKPNVLFIAIDDLNDWVGVFDGNPQVKTPNLDRFNEQGGLAMYDAHVPSTVCGPRAPLFLPENSPTVLAFMGIRQILGMRQRQRIY